MQSGTTMGTGAVDAKRWTAASRAVNTMSDSYRAAAASSGLLEASQLRVNSETARYTELLQKQKLSLRDVIRQRPMLQQVYKDQLKLQRMTLTSRGTDKFGREISDITVPTRIGRDLDSINNRLKFTRSLIQSSAAQMINWGKNTQWAGRQLTVGLTMPMAMFAAAAGKVAYDVDKEFTRIAKVYDSQLSKEALSADKAKELQTLRTRSFAMARDMAKQYGAAITDVLGVEAQLAATGLSGEALIGGTGETVRIAALGEVDFTQATDMTVALQTAFKDTIKTTADLTEVFDYMNYVENTTSLSIQDIAEATPRAASGLAALGVTAKEMTILLVAMREAGIDAAEGANALKSASTRILNVVPEAEAKFAGKLSGKWNSVQEIADAAGGNLFDFLRMLAKATDEMDNISKQKGIAKLFGTYQYNRLNAALTGVTDTIFGLGDGTTQAAKAFDGLKMSAADLAAVSAGEVAKQAASASGQFKRAWEGFKISMAEAGEAMLPIGTTIISILSNILDMGMAVANAIPGWAKPFLFWGAAITAVAGPVIMLAGLIANLTGWGMKLIGFGSKFNIMNRQQKAAELQALATKNAYLTEAEAVALLVNELMALSGAQAASISAARRAQQDALASSGIITGAAAQRYAHVGPIGPMTAQQSAMATGAVKENGRMAYTGPIGPMTKEQTQDYKRLNAERLMGSKLETDIHGQTRSTAAEQGNITKAAKNSNIAFGAMNATLLASAVTSGKLQATLMATSVGLMAASSLQAMGLGNVIANAWGGSKTKTKMTGFATKSRTVFSSAGKYASVFGRALLGPIGLAITALGTVGYLIYKSMKEPERRQEAINRSTAVWADTLDLVEKKYKSLSLNSYEDTSITPENLAERLTESEDGVKMVEAMKEALDQEDTIEQNRLALQEYIKIMTELNGSAEDAKAGIEGLFIASGLGIFDASDRAAELAAMAGTNIGKAQAKAYEAQVQAMFSADPKQFDERTAGLIGMIKTDLESAKNWSERNKIVLDFQTALDGQTGGNWTEMLLENVHHAQRDMLQAAFDAMGPDAAKEAFDLLKQWREGGYSAVGWGSEEENAGLGATDLLVERLGIAEKHAVTLVASAGNYNSSIETVANSHGAIVQALADELGIHGEIKTMNDLIASEQWQRATTNNNNVKKRVQLIKDEAAAEAARLRATGGFFANYKAAQTEAYALAKMNNRLTAVGMTTISSIYDEIDWKQLRSLEKQKAEGKEIDKNKQKMKAALAVWKEFSTTGIVDVTKSAWETTTGLVAERASQALQDRQSDQMEALEDNQENAMDSLEAASERESAILDRRSEYWSNFYDKAIERANAYYDNRIDKLNRVLEAEERANDTRQRIFEAEQTRLQRIADSANTNIDFNMALNEGNLDEAARIMNQSAVDAAANQMDDEIKRADTELEARRASLEAQIKMLEKQRDLKVKGLENARDMKEKAIEAARERYEIEADMQRKALEESSERQKEALEAQFERERRHQERGLALLRAFIPRNKKELTDYMKELDEKYNLFGMNLKGRATQWGNFIGNEQNHQLDIAARKMKSEVNWAGAGYDAANGMLKGMATAMGFKGVGELRKWMGISMKGGERPEGGGRGQGARSTWSNEELAAWNESRHSGGEIGVGGGKRTGFSGRQSRHSEVTVNAQRGEYMMSKKAHNRYGTDFMNAVNDGAFGIGGPGDVGMMGAMVPFLARSMYSLMFGSVADQAEMASKKKAASSVLGMFGPLGVATAGTYGDTAFSAEQLRNAGIIASVGQSMGMSQRDIVIGLMTAMQESMLRNVDYGDRDSLGLFQQRPSQGWGTPAQVTDPEYASRKFFSVLKTIEGRDTMPLTYAAQAVQRSAYPTAYAKWEDEARAIVAALSAGGGTTFVQGAGGRHRPVAGGVVTQGLHYNNAIDLGVPTGTPVYSVADGKILKSYDIPGYESRQPDGGNGYKSYGRVIVVDHGGFQTLYAHLSARGAATGQSVRGGARIGLSGDTGNSSGPHLHFEAHGASPYAFLAKGGTVKRDNTPAILHRNERVLTADLTKELDTGIQNLGKLDVKALAYAVRNFVASTKGAAGPKGSASAPASSNNISGYEGDSGKKSTVRTGTYNVFHGTSNAASQNDLAALMKRADVLSLTEYVGHKRALNAWMAKQGWGVYGKGGRGRDSVVAYNQRKYNFLGGGDWKMNKPDSDARQAFGGSNYGSHFAAYAHLKDKKTGRSFWQIAAHTIAHSKHHRPAIAVQIEQYKRLNELYEKLSGHGEPVFLGGDFNPSALGVKGMLARIGLRSGRNSGLDHVLFGGKNKLTGQSVLSAGMASDHPAYLAQFNIPGLAKGGHIKWDNTLINAHKDETMLTSDLSKKMEQGVENFANGGGTGYNVVIDLRGAYIKEELDIERAVNKAIDRRESKVGRKRIVK